MDERQEKMGVLMLVFHLIITLAFIAVYVTFAFMNKDASTIEMILIAIVGYWFGAISMNNKPVGNGGVTNISTAKEVTVKPEANKDVTF